MNSKELGELASDQKIQNVFRAFGYSIPIGKDGRRRTARSQKDFCHWGWCEHVANLRTVAG